jgi:hypothetical protein
MSLRRRAAAVPTAFVMVPKREPPPSAESGSDRRRVVVSLDDACLNNPAHWKAAVARLKQAGLDVTRELDVIGVVAGSVPESHVASLKNVEHVVSVEDDAKRGTAGT